MSEKDFETKNNQAPEAEETVTEDTSIQEYRAEGTAEGGITGGGCREKESQRIVTNRYESQRIVTDRHES